MTKKWGISIKKESESLIFTGLKIPRDYWEVQEDFIKQIEELPESADIFLSVSDTQLKSLEQLKNLPVELYWLQVYQPNVEFQGGLGYRIVARYAENDNRKDMTEQELLEVYCLNLESVLGNPEVWEGLFPLNGAGGAIYANPKPLLEETYEDAKKLTELKSENYCIYGSRDEILEFLQENELDSMYVENVTLW